MATFRASLPVLYIFNGPLLWVWVCVGMPATLPMWRPEDTFVEWMISFHFHVCSPTLNSDQPGLCSKCFYPLRHLTGARDSFLRELQSPVMMGQREVGLN